MAYKALAHCVSAILIVMSSVLRLRNLTQRSKAICPRLHSRELAEQELEPQSESKPHARLAPLSARGQEVIIHRWRGDAYGGVRASLLGRDRLEEPGKDVGSR